MSDEQTEHPHPEPAEHEEASPDRAAIRKAYIDHLLEHGHPPASVHAFAKHLGISERTFFEHFASFHALEGSIWGDLVDEVAHAVTSGEEWQHFTAREQMLSFFYAFTESMLDHRSFFLERFPRPSSGSSTSRTGLRATAKLRHRFREFVHPVLDAGVASGELKQRGPIGDRYPRILTTLFLSVIHYNLTDESEGFSRTDAYIEKSTHLAFDLMGAGVVDSALDLARFLGGHLRHQ